MSSANSSPSPSSPPGRPPHLLELLRRYGWTTVSFQALEPGVSVHGDLQSDGAVAYADTGAAWVAAGGPIAPVERLDALAHGFVSEASARGRRVCFCASEARLSVPGLSRLQLGEQPVWSAQRWPEIVKGSRSLREQLRRARAKGVTVRRLEAAEADPEHPVRRAIDALVSQWLRTRRGPGLRFLLDVHLFEHNSERMLFVAEHDGAVVGILSAVPIYARGGWFFEDVLRTAAAPNGTAESLIDAAMHAAAESGSDHVTMGLVPLAGSVSPWLRAARMLGRPFYDFEGLYRFRQKLKPQAWEPVYLAYPMRTFAIVALWDVLTAVMGMSPFAWSRAALRQRA